LVWILNIYYFIVIKSFVIYNYRTFLGWIFNIQTNNYRVFFYCQAIVVRVVWKFEDLCLSANVEITKEQIHFSKRQLHQKFKVFFSKQFFQFCHYVIYLKYGRCQMNIYYFIVIKSFVIYNYRTFLGWWSRKQLATWPSSSLARTSGSTYNT
jgi:hypothetical protein